MSEGSTPTSSRLLLALGVVAFWAVLGLMSYRLDVPLMDGIVLAVLLGALPAFALAQVPMIGEQRVEREPAYWSSIATLWIIGTACWLAGSREDSIASVELGSIGLGPMLVWTLGLTGGALLIIYLFRAAAIALKQPETEILRDLLPRTWREKWIFGFLSLAAGVFEEVAYRAYAITALAPFTGTVGAVAISSIAFGAVHGYQGVLGVVRTTIMGGLLAWGFVATGSLWPGMVAHTAIDILAGIVLGERLLIPAQPSGQTPADSLPTDQGPWT